MTPSDLANALPFALLAACLWRARLLALALLPPCMLILANWAKWVDISSASHPLRWITPVSSLSLAMLVAHRYTRWVLVDRLARRDLALGDVERKLLEATLMCNSRALLASILVFASGCADVPALLMWELPGIWVLVPLQIGACFVVLGVLLVPERWVHWWIT